VLDAFDGTHSGGPVIYSEFTFQETDIKVFRALNLIVAFLFELIVIAAYASVGMIVHGSAPMRYGIAAIATSTVIALWARFAAPLSQHRLTPPRLYYFKLAIFAGGAAILVTAHRVHLAIYFVLIAIFSLALEASQRKP
jgi:hypothetical protein